MAGCGNVTPAAIWEAGYAAGGAWGRWAHQHKRGEWLWPKDAAVPGEMTPAETLPKLLGISWHWPLKGLSVGGWPNSEGNVTIHYVLRKMPALSISSVIQRGGRRRFRTTVLSMSVLQGRKKSLASQRFDVFLYSILNKYSLYCRFHFSIPL